MAIIEAEDLTKVFGKLVAVDHVSFAVEEEEIFGFLGPNGAGKTTTINMFTTLLRPTKGTARVAGFDVVKEANAVRSAIGLVPQDLTADEDLTGRENMMLVAKLYHVPKEVARRRIDEVLKLVDLSDAAHRKAKTYSGGMRKRLELAEGLIHYPKVLFLDEPTLGLDVQTRTVIWDYIRGLREEQKVTIFLTTHYMEEADALCDRIAIIDHGKIKALDKPANLKESIGGDIVELSLAQGAPDVTQTIASIPLVKEVRKGSHAYRIKVRRGEECLPRIIQRMINEGLKVERASLLKPTLDQVYLEITGRSIRETEGSEEEAWRMRSTLRRLKHAH